MFKVFAMSANPKSLGNWFREKRFNFFKSNLQLLIHEKQNETLPIKILDVGGTTSYWENRGFHENPLFCITLLNLFAQPAKHKNIISVKGNATDLSNFQDKEFDIVFSNSVIEHLYTYENQKKMSAEVQRVGKYHFIQTPNKHFFIEPHFLLPFFQYFPKQLKYSILVKTKLSRGRKWNEKFAARYVEEIDLISFKRIKVLFPQSEIHKEKVLGMIKSFTAHNFNGLQKHMKDESYAHLELAE